MKADPQGIDTLLAEIDLYLLTKKTKYDTQLKKMIYLNPEVEALNILNLQFKTQSQRMEEVDPHTLNQLIGKFNALKNPASVMPQYQASIPNESLKETATIQQLHADHAYFVNDKKSWPKSTDFPNIKHIDDKRTIISDRDLVLSSVPLSTNKYAQTLTMLNPNLKQQKIIPFNIDMNNLQSIDFVPILKDEQQHPHQTVYFNQADIIPKVEKKGDELRRLNNALKKYNGLCEIICNHLVINDLLRPDNTSLGQDLQNLNQTANLQKLEKEVAPLHILKQVSLFQLFKAALFNKIPHNYLSDKKQNQLNKIASNIIASKDVENEQAHDLIKSALFKVKSGSYAKFFAYSKKGIEFQGHSMLIRKNKNGTYTFYDPNEGAKTYSDIKELGAKIMSSFLVCNQSFGCTNMCFMNVGKMLPKPEKKLSGKLKQG